MQKWIIVHKADTLIILEKILEIKNTLVKVADGIYSEDEYLA